MSKQIKIKNLHLKNIVCTESLKNSRLEYKIGCGVIDEPEQNMEQTYRNTVPDLSLKPCHFSSSY